MTSESVRIGCTLSAGNVSIIEAWLRADGPPTQKLKSHKGSKVLSKYQRFICLGQAYSVMSREKGESVVVVSIFSAFANFHFVFRRFPLGTSWFLPPYWWPLSYKWNIHGYEVKHQSNTRRQNCVVSFANFRALQKEYKFSVYTEKFPQDDKNEKGWKIT